MDEDQTGNGASRRALIKRWAALGVGMALVVVSNRASSEAGKISKAWVGYVDDGKIPGKDCDDCIHYIVAKSADEAATCQLVEGPINPHGHCRAFTPASKK